MQLRDIVIHLNCIEGIGPSAVQRLLTVYGTNLHVIYDEHIQDFVGRGFGRQCAERLVRGLADTAVLDRELELIAEHGVDVMSIHEERYPAYLRAIHYPPPVLYIRGVLPTDVGRAVAIVGSRDANAYGNAIVDLFGAALIEQGYIIVSGGARGIDIRAHQIATKKQGITVVVLGSGLLRPYPAEHTGTFMQIAESGGAIVSPFPLTAPPVKGNFPARNRIIAGCATYCIVVQAAEKSGALITASYALHEGREVGAVPGSVLDPLSRGCHMLLAEGAALLSSVEELYRFVGLSHKDVQHTAGEVQEIAEKTAIAGTVADQIRVVCMQPQTMDELLGKTGMTVEQLYDCLWDLQVQGVVEQTPTGRWRNC